MADNLLDILKHQIADATVECPRVDRRLKIDCTTCGGTGEVAKYPWARKECPCICREFTAMCYDCIRAGEHTEDCHSCGGATYLPTDNLEWLCLQILCGGGVAIQLYQDVLEECA